MSARSEELAKQVEQANSDLLAAVESSTPGQWSATCADGVWSQGFAGFHAATSIRFVTGMVKGIADGQPFPPTTLAQIDEGNAASWSDHAGCTKAETVDLIKASAPAASGIVRALNDAQLDRKVTLLEGMPEMSAQQVVEMLLIGHPRGHLQSIINAR